MQYKQVEDILKAVSDETRLKIIACISRDTFCGCELVEILNMSQPAISQHLKRLRETGITNEEKRGRWVYYSLNKNHELYPLILHLVSLLSPFNLIENRIACN